MENEILKSLEILRNGGIILYPTDTIWGIGCDATNFQSISQIYKIKKRQDNKSMLVLVDSFEMIKNFVEKIPEKVFELVENFIEPLTIIYPKAKNLPQNLVNQEDGSIGIRIVKENFCKNLIKNFAKPIVSTSANLSGNPFPKNFSEIDKEISENVDYIVNFRREENSVSLPSRIIKVFENNEISIIR